MGSGSKHEIPPVAEYLDSAPTVNVDTYEKVTSPTLPTSHSSDPTLLGPGAPNFDGWSAESCVDKDEVNASPPAPSLAQFVLGSFFFAMFLISLITFIVFFAVTWFTVCWDARLMKDQAFSNANGVSLHTYFTNLVLLTVAVAAGINTRPQPSTGSRCMHVIHFVDGCSLRCACNL